MSEPRQSVHEAISHIADQLCVTIDDRFDVRLSIDSDDDQVMKLAMMINFLLDRVRRTIDKLEESRETLEQRVAERTAELKLIVDGSNDGVWVWDLQTDALDLSDRWLAQLGLRERDDPSADFWLSRVHREDLGRLRSALKRLLHGVDAAMQIEYRMRTHSGTWRWMVCRGAAQFDHCGAPVRMAGTQSDITALLCTDGESGLPNERALREEIEQHLYLESDAGFALVSIDTLVQLLQVLDHGALRALRKAVRDRLVNTLPITALIARLPGDVFGVLLPGLVEEQAMEAALQKLLAEFRTPVPAGAAGPQWLTLSIGVTRLGGAYAQTTEECFKCAWSALRLAQHEPRSAIRIFDPSVQSAAAQRLRTETTVREALSDDRVQPFFQPVVDARTGALLGAEALVRIARLEGGHLPPGEFLPAVEGTELMVALSERMLRRSLQALRGWLRSGWWPHDAFVSVNVAAQQLMMPDFAERVVAVLTDAEVPPRLLKVEVTETAMVANFEQATEQLKLLRHHGLRVALDDFGTGYSSLEYLQRLPIDTLKMDRSFVHRMLDGREGTAIAQTVVNLANVIGLDVIAEGVERREQIDLLAGFGVHAIQGYWFSPPVPEGAFTAGFLRALAEAV